MKWGNTVSALKSLRVEFFRIRERVQLTMDAIDSENDLSASRNNTITVLGIG